MNITIPDGYEPLLTCKYKPFADEPPRVEQYSCWEMEAKLKHLERCGRFDFAIVLEKMEDE
jgi:hypothetical protein